MSKILRKIFMMTVLTLLLVFDSSGAVVVDNDSSAYLTKREFEVIKKDFAERIKKYDGNIDEKIDDAIATYLSRMDVKTETVGLPLARRYKNIYFSNLSKNMFTEFLQIINKLNTYIFYN